MTEVAVLGVGMHPWGKFEDKSVTELCRHAVVAVLTSGDAAVEVDDPVASSPEDPAVDGASVVVDEVALVLDPAVAVPADGVPLRVGQRLGHDHVGVERDDLVAEPLGLRGPGVGGQHDLVRDHRSGGGGEADPP